MKFFLDIPIPNAPHKFSYEDSLFLIGSCFSEHIGSKLSSLHFSMMQNPHGILFDSYALIKAFDDYIHNSQYSESDLFYLNDVWNAWSFHSSFSELTASETIKKMNHSISAAHHFLKSTNWLVITLGSAYSYKNNETQNFVANCHKANQNIFNKELIPIDQLVDLWKNCIASLRKFNPSLKIIFTVSPVRHIRDGVIENNRSKARLIETVHSLINNEDVFYFPSYEYQIDVLRDYRFFDIDLVHPNFAATEFILARFFDWFLNPNNLPLLNELKSLLSSKNHRPLHSETQSHKQFLSQQHKKCLLLQKDFPFLDLQKEISYFSQ